MSDLGWVDGRIVSADDPALRAADGAPFEGGACYTTARWTGAGIRHEERHLARLARDAATLALGVVATDTVRQAFRALGQAAFGEAEGVIRIEASRGAGGVLRLVGTARSLGPEPASWRAITLPFPHEGPSQFGGAKRSNRLVHTLGRDHVRGRGADEGLLLDVEDRLVEGTRTNLVTVGADGLPCVPPGERGAVAGLALEIASEALPELVRRDCLRAELADLRELVALNAVRGAVPITELDGRPLGSGSPGPVAARLAAALDAAG